MTEAVNTRRCALRGWTQWQAYMSIYFIYRGHFNVKIEIRIGSLALTANVLWCWNIPFLPLRPFTLYCRCRQVLHSALPHPWQPLHTPLSSVSWQAAIWQRKGDAEGESFILSTQAVIGISIPYTSSSLKPSVSPLGISHSHCFQTGCYRLWQDCWSNCTAGGKVGWGLGVEEQLQSQDKQKLEDAGLPWPQPDTTKSNARKDNWHHTARAKLLLYDAARTKLLHVGEFQQ